MKGKIDERGILWIERAGELKQMRCVNRHDHFCRDCCPLFGTPCYIRASDSTALPICQSDVLQFQPLEDQRQAPQPLAHPDHDKTCALNNGDVVCTCGKGN